MVDEKAFNQAVKIAGLSYLLSIPGNKETVIKLFEAYEAAKEQPDELTDFLAETKPNIIVQDANQSWWKPSLIVQFAGISDAKKFGQLLTDTMDRT